MCIHLLTNASVLNRPGTFQNAVYQIHSLEKLLPVVEWVFIFLPIIFHAVFGVVIIRGGLPNVSSYNYTSNVRYTLQRVTGMIAFLFIFWHVFHMHGWFHADWWLKSVAEPFGGAKFKPYNAASTLGQAMTGFAVPLLYAIGVLSCVFHLANGIWTMGITWGLWITPAAQRRATAVCSSFGVLLALVGMSALWGAKTVDVKAAKEAEDKLYEAKLESGEIPANSKHKRSDVAGGTDETDETGDADETVGANETGDSTEAETDEKQTDTPAGK